MVMSMYFSLCPSIALMTLWMSDGSRLLAHADGVVPESMPVSSLMRLVLLIGIAAVLSSILKPPHFLLLEIEPLSRLVVLDNDYRRAVIHERTSAFSLASPSVYETISL